jgi:hypothetical protein
MLSQHDIDWCSNCEDSDMMLLHLLKKHHGYYLATIPVEQREIVKKSLDLQLESVKMYLFSEIKGEIK